METQHGPDHSGTDGVRTTSAHTLATTYAGSPVTVTIDGLPAPHAQSLAELAHAVITKMDAARVERQEERRTAHRLHEQQHARRAVKMTEADRLRRARLGQENTRPVTAEAYVSPITRGAALTFLDKHGNISPTGGAISLDGIHSSPMADDVLTEAGLQIAHRGFTYARGARWAPHGTGAARVAIAPTAAYLAYIERRYGPVPDVPNVDGLTVKATERGWWEVTGGLEPYWLTWSPQLHGDRWTVWAGVAYEGLRLRPTRLVARTGDVDQALAAITNGR